MANLIDELTERLPKILSANPLEALNSTKIIEALPPSLVNTYADASIRTSLSKMAADSASILARVDGKQGYYLRTLNVETESPASDGQPAIELESDDGSSGGRLADQLEEKFRAFFIRHQVLVNKSAMKIDHLAAKKTAGGINKWKFPDVAVVAWEHVGFMNNDEFRLDGNLLDVKRSLGEQPFYIESVELKADLAISNFRKYFFQCVSNSKWSHRAILAVAMPITDAILVEELRRLGTSYDVTVVSYSMNPKTLPSADEITKLSEERFNELVESHELQVTTIVTGRRRETLDWDFINDLRAYSSDFVQLFEWIGYCLAQKKAFSFDDYAKIVSIQKRY